MLKCDLVQEHAYASPAQASLRAQPGELACLLDGGSIADCKDGALRPLDLKILICDDAAEVRLHAFWQLPLHPAAS